jgi:glycosyltransferase involved in cell wall biosynthesis
LVKQVNARLEADRPRIGITTLPLVADLMSGLNVDAWIYYCVDDFTVWPGLDHRPLQAMESELVKNADRIIAVSRTLQDRIEMLGGQSTLMTHGVDVAHWQNVEDFEVRSDVMELDSPLIVFWGLIDKRMDEAFVTQLSKELSFGTIALVGPTDNPPARLFELPRVRHLESMTLNELAALGQRADVLIMPYVDEEVTRAMQPLKMLEYLATGKPVVARRLPAAQPWADCLELAETARGFSTLVMDVLEKGLADEKAEARQRLVSESWTSKAGELKSIILELAQR